MKVITKFVNPPIPVRAFDWLAYRDGDEEGPQGWGNTELEAIQDLADHLESDCDHQYKETNTAPLGVTCIKCGHFVGAHE